MNMRKKLYKFEELERYFMNHGVEWIGRCFDIYAIKDGENYVIDDYDYAFKKGIQYTIEFDFTHGSIDIENIEDSIKQFNEDSYNQAHGYKVKFGNDVIASYIMSCITDAEE